MAVYSRTHYTSAKGNRVQVEVHNWHTYVTVYSYDGTPIVEWNATDISVKDGHLTFRILGEVGVDGTDQYAIPLKDGVRPMMDVSINDIRAAVRAIKS